MAKEKTQKGSSYSAKDIFVLEGLEPVRKRPGMYIGSTDVEGLHRLIWEILDNSIDEAMAGHANNISVELLDSKTVRVTDDGRGVPVDIHPHTKKTTLETVMTVLHAGGKFGGSGYKISGGLHGVGASVVNALSTYVRAEIKRDGSVYVQEYALGKPQGPVKKTGKSEGTGTSITFSPDETIFHEVAFDRKKILDRIRQQAYLTKGVRLIFVDYREETPFCYSFNFSGGIKTYVEYLSEGGGKFIQDEIFYLHKENGEGSIEAAIAYTEDIETQEMGFANNIYTPDGGSHITGLRSAITRTLNDYSRQNNFIKGNEDNFTGEDVREGLVAVVSVKLSNPQFEGQTKARLGNPETRSAVEMAVSEAFKEFLEKHPADGKKIAEKCLLAAKARKAAKAAKETILRKGALEGLTLPGKLADCQTRKSEESELFIVEGDSAGGCFVGDTQVALTDGRDLNFKQLVDEDKLGKKNYCYTIKNDGSIGVGLIKSPRKTKENAKIVKVILDNEEAIYCTPDHRFMLRDGSYKEARNLIPSDSLMPFRRQLSKLGKRITIKDYELVYDPKEKRWIFTHLLADRYNLFYKKYEKQTGDAIHHMDFNKRNNNPENLIRMPKMEHLLYHANLLEKTIHRADIKEKAKQAHKSRTYWEKIRKVMNAPEVKKMLSERAKKQWQDENYKKYMASSFFEFYKNNSEYREKNKQILYENQKKYWSKLINKQKQAEKTKEYFRAHPEKREEFAVCAIKQWQNKELLAWRSQKTREQWTSEFRTRRKATYNQTYRDKALKLLREIFDKNREIDKKDYNEERLRRRDKSLLKYETICQRFFENDENNLKEAVLNYNHKIKRIVKLEKKVDVYDLEVEDTHNFALSSGIFVHNSAKQGRDRRIQAILPLKGKILNVEKAQMYKMLANNEIRALIVALGTAVGAEFDITKLRYGKVVIMTDADVDGSHIRTLLLTLFYRHFSQLIENGHIYIAEPPLYKVQIGKQYKYVYSDAEKDKVIKEMGGNPSIQRYKGLGEMNPEQLWDTTMNPETRTMRLVTVGDAKEADKLFDILMGSEVEPRKRFIQIHAASVKNLDI